MLAFILKGLVVLVHFTAAFCLLVYGVNYLILIALFRRSGRRTEQVRRAVHERAEQRVAGGDLPPVTTQIAVFNEYNVIERVMHAACRMRYPAGRHEIQVLDDSNDETKDLVDATAAQLRAAGHDVKVLRRPTRQGFKAGALAYGLARARGELVAVFDADFVPQEDFLLQMVPYFLDDERLGFVQARWGHTNQDRSLLTRVQSIGVDGHFMVEQPARNWSGLYMNFNGTAGVWRAAAIEAGGGWAWDTLTEDLDLSYRVQFAGWHGLYLPDVVVPAELPEDISAFRTQQFRWAKGSIQTFLKLLPRLREARVAPFAKIEAVLHMTGYAVHPLMLTIAVLALPALLWTPRFCTGTWFLGILAIPFGAVVLAPSTLYGLGQALAYPHWLRRLLYLPFGIALGVGLALSNSWGILEALAGRHSEFVRTAKRGQRELKRYAHRVPAVAFGELALGLYAAYVFGLYVAAGKYVVSAFLTLYAAGFLFFGLLTLAQAWESNSRRRGA